MPIPHAPTRHGFTLIELIGVMVLVSIVSVTAIPSLSRLDTARDAAMIGECERLLRFAQSSAVSTGLPTGLRLDLDVQQIGLLTIDPDAGGTLPLQREAVGAPLVLYVESTFAGSRIEAAGPEGSVLTGGQPTVWFAFDGTPQTRDQDGENPEPLAEGFVIRSERGREITVTPVTGMVQR